MIVYSDGAIPIKCWCNNPEDGAIAQAKNMAELPFAFKHIALMPDTHQGYGVCIGGVLATRGVVLPSAVGVDIGCGVIAAATDIHNFTVEQVKEWMGKMRQVVPVGHLHHKEPQESWFFEDFAPVGPVTEAQLGSAKNQLGTLGSGNHFLELQKDNDGSLWVMIHSGSRNLGKKVADHYTKIAKDLNQKWYSSIPPEWDLSFLPVNTDEADEYIHEMGYCVEFARANRALMMQRVLEVMGADRQLTIDVSHNYARIESHYGQNVWVHRKGATSARDGEYGIIPGSQGTKSYIVKGKGNPLSFNSCSHGAGRAMGRKDAQRRLNLEDEKKLLDDQGIVHGIRSEKDLDEAAGAYKDVSVVISEQLDLIDVIAELTPVGVIKG